MSQDTTPKPEALQWWLARRQLAVALIVLFGTAGLLLSGRIGEASWLEATIWTVGLYMLGEAAGAWATTWRKP